MLKYYIVYKVEFKCCVYFYIEYTLKKLTTLPRRGQKGMVRQELRIFYCLLSQSLKMSKYCGF